MSEKLYLPYSTGCFVCGHNNERGLQVQFYVRDNAVKVDLNFKDCFNSFPNVTHGGILSSILDEAMGWAAFIFSDITTFLFTRELTVTYKKNASTNTPMVLTAEFVSMERGGMYLAKGRIEDSAGKIITAAKGLFYPTSQEKMDETKPHLCFSDEIEYHPKAVAYCKI
ncbi:MAG: PaaI family thioesterase [Mucispirillum sp.]|nr:PaaI family thioesterase [Mucispirillum sp.]